MNKIWIKMVLIVLVLLVMTLFFLEFPRLYFQYSDYLLLKESGTRQYEDVTIQEKVGGFKETEEYFSYVGDRRNDFGDSVVSNEIAYETILELAGEMKLLLSPECEKVVEEFMMEYNNAIGYTKRMSYGEKYWDVGFLEFHLPRADLSGTVLYDAKSCKIVWLEFGYGYLGKTQTPPVQTNETIVSEYYKELTFTDIWVLQRTGQMIVAPYSEKMMRDELLNYMYVYTGENEIME